MMVVEELEKCWATCRFFVLGQVLGVNMLVLQHLMGTLFQ